MGVGGMGAARRRPLGGVAEADPTTPLETRQADSNPRGTLHVPGQIAERLVTRISPLPLPPSLLPLLSPFSFFFFFLHS